MFGGGGGGGWAALQNHFGFGPPEMTIEQFKPLSAGHCTPWVLPYGIGRVKGALKEAEQLAWTRMPPKHWRNLKKIEQNLQSFNFALAQGDRPKVPDLKRLSWIVYQADRSYKEAEEFATLGKYSDEIAPDVAERIHKVFDDVQQHSNFLFSQAYPCVTKNPNAFPPKSEKIWEYSGVQIVPPSSKMFRGMEPGHWTPADLGPAPPKPAPKGPYNDPRASVPREMEGSRSLSLAKMAMYSPATFL